MALIRCAAPYPHWQFRAPHGDGLQLVPERGGLVSGWICSGPWGERQMLYFDAERFADPGKSVRGGIPVLFPICGGLGGSPLPQHGFARDLPWQLQELPDGTGVVMELQDGPRTRELFPHAFGLRLSLRPEPQSLAISLTVGHRGPAGSPPLPFSLGLHPYFAVSDLGQARLEGLPAAVLDQVRGERVATAERLPQLAEGVDLLAEPDGPVRLVLADPPGLTISLEAEPPLDLAVVWTEPPRPMLCLEPWTAPRGALSSGERLLTLQPGEHMELRCRYRVSAA